MPVRIVQITDPHLLPSGELLMGMDVNARLDDVLEHAAARKPDAIFLTGDFCAAEPQQEVYHQLRDRLDQLSIPYFLTPGNHDDREMMRNAFPIEGQDYDPIREVVRIKDRNFVFIDSSTGAVNNDQVKWLAEALKKYPVADVVLHHPPVPLGVRFMDNTYPLRETERLVSALTADGRPRKIFCGHYHSGRTVAWQNLEIHLCPPTSFFINPDNEEFEQEMLPPGYLMLEWGKDGSFRAVPSYVV